MKNTLFLVVSFFIFAATAQAECYMIDPNKADTLRCEDHSFKNVSYTLEGPQQEFVFTSSDGQTHSVTFKNHEECRSKLLMVKKAQMDETHPWVQVETTPLSFAVVDHPVSKEVPGVRAISSEGHYR